MGIPSLRQVTSKQVTDMRTTSSHPVPSAMCSSARWMARLVASRAFIPPPGGGTGWGACPGSRRYADAGRAGPASRRDHLLLDADTRGHRALILERHGRRILEGDPRRVEDGDLGRR